MTQEDANDIIELIELMIDAKIAFNDPETPHFERNEQAEELKACRVSLAEILRDLETKGNAK